ncbi:MAG: hypothetical protein EBY17_10655 [Acidobacteriia bacterium]|nr:hypothetical protein [Terriglobia bacterium]
MRKLIALLTVALLAAAAHAAGAVRVAGDARLIDAVKRRDAAMVARLIEQGAAVNGQLADGSTALTWAVYSDDKRVRCRRQSQSPDGRDCAHDRRRLGQPAGG